MKLNRRRFLTTALVAGVALGTGGIALPCCSFGKGRLYREDLAQQNLMGLDNRRKLILHYASLAPSGHNSQPWTVKIINENEWVIGIDAKRRLTATDPDNRIILLSLGAFVENLSLAAGASGFHPDITIIAKEAGDRDILKIRLSASKTVEYPLSRLEKRVTAKKGYLSKEIMSSDVKAFSDLAEGSLFYFPRGTSHARCIEEGAIENFRLQVNRYDAQKELVRWLRLKDRDVEKFRDGLTVNGMEITGIKGWFVKHFVDPEDFLKDSFKKQSVDHTAKLASQGGGWFIITSDGHSVSHIVNAGRKFERIALAAREKGIGLQPMTQYLEERNGQNQIRDNHPPEIMPQFVIRAGYLEKYPDPVSPRRPIDWFVRA